MKAPWHGSRAAPLELKQSRLKLDLRAELQYARIVSRGHLAEVRVVRTRVDILKFRMVESVKAFKTHLKFHVFCEGEGLESG